MRAMAHVAFLGAGMIAAGMIEGLRRRGEEVAVWNRTAAKAQALAAVGARVAEAPIDAVRGAARVHVVLSDDAAVDAVLEAARPGLDRGAVVVDHSTTSPAGTARRAAAMQAEGRAFLHAPVFMSPQFARDAKGMILVAGPRATFERVRGELEKMTGEVWWLGERPDLAAANKLFGNAAIMAIVAGLADIYAMADALEIERRDAHALFSKFKVGATVDARGAKMASGDFTPTFDLTMARKDVRLMIEAAGDEPLAALPAIADAMDRAIAAGRGALDLGALASDPPAKKGDASR